MIHRLFAAWHSRADRHVIVDGQRLFVPRGVMDPVAFRTGAWFAPWAARQVCPGQQILDLCAGSGVVGLLCARAGARVTALDRDPRSIAACRANGLEDARIGDLFAPVAGQRFDHIFANPPYFNRDPHAGPLDHALYGGAGYALIARLAAAAPAHLRPGGAADVVLSERARGSAAALGPGWRPIAWDRVDGELLAVWRLTADHRGP